MPEAGLRRRIGVGLALLSLAVASCTGDDTGDEVAGPVGGDRDVTTTGEVTLLPTTRPLELDAAEGLEILEDRIVIPAGHMLADVAADQVVALGVTDQTPNGMLRYVTAVQDDGGRVVAMTRQATLEETFQEVDLTASVPLTFDAIDTVEGTALGRTADGEQNDAAPGAGQIVLAAPAGGPFHLAQTSEELQTDIEPFESGFVIAFDRVLDDADDDLSTTDDQVRAAGSVTAVLDIEIDLDIGVGLSPLGLPTGELDSASFIVGGNVATNLEIETEHAATFGDEVELFAVEFSPIPVPVGPIVVVLRPRMPIVLGWEGRVSAAFQTSVTTSTNARVGVEFVDGEWEPVDDVSGPDFDFDPPTLDGAEPATMSVRAGPRVEFRLWEEFASASVGIDGVTQVDLLPESPWSCLKAGVRAPVGFELLGESLFGHTVYEKMFDLAPDPCDGDEAPPVGAAPVAGYSRVFGSCTPLGEPVGESGRMIAALADGGVIVAAGATREAPAGTQAARFDDLWLLRLDAAGDLVWSRKYRDLTGNVVALAPAGDGFVVGFETGRLMFVDGWGEPSSSGRLQGLAFHLRGLTAVPGGNGFLAFGAEGQDPIVARLGSDGSVQWAHRYTGDIPRGGSRAASPRADGGWNVALAPGYFAIIESGGEVRRAARLAINDALEYQVDASGHGTTGTLGVGSGGTLFIIDAELEEATGTGTGTSMAGIRGLSDGGFATTGGERIARVSAAGALRWTVGYDSGDESGGGFRQLAQTTDGGIVTTGRTATLAAERCGRVFDSPGSSDDHWDVWVLKVPPNGLMTPNGDSGVRRSSFEAEVWDGTQELIPVELVDETFPLTTRDDGDSPSFRVYPGVSDHLSDLVEGGVLYTIPSATFNPRVPLAITYEYLQGGEVSTRITTAWDGDNWSVTAVDATLREGDLPADLRIILGPDNPWPRNAEVRGQGILPVTLSEGGPAFFPPLLGITPNFDGPIPAVDVTHMETFVGVDAACGVGVYDDALFPQLGAFGDIDLCIDEATGAVLFAHTRGRCEDPDRTDNTCVEMRAVDIRPVTDSDFALFSE